MNRTLSPNAVRPALLLNSALMLTFTLFSSVAWAQWTQPTEEELKMTAQPEVPGAPAVYLFREEDTEDKAHTWSKYERIKVLTEAGRSYANVEIRQYKGTAMRGYTVQQIEARTIHPDGTVIPFTGKVEDKLIEQREGFKETAKVFTLPDVEVGSIIEYRYRLEYYDHLIIAPSWNVQSELFTRKAHYLWRPTMGNVTIRDAKGGRMADSIGWLPILPKDAAFTHVMMSGTGINAGQAGQTIMEFKIQNVPPAPHEQYMPPPDSLTYRVRFYFTPYLTSEQFWKTEGKRWSEARDQFIGPGDKINSAVQQIVSTSDTPDLKLRKIYAAVQKIENITYTQGFTLAQDKQHGIESPRSADELWERKAGHSDEITEVFVAMARAAGIKAYLMAVTNRSRFLFDLNYLSIGQLQDYLAVVNVGGKDLFLDPGEPFCPYGSLAWPHTATTGLRQTDGGTRVEPTPVQSYKDSRTQRIANLELDDHGNATGTIKMTWTGEDALRWRQLQLRGDLLSLQREMSSAVEKLLPTGLLLSVSGIQNLTEYENPFIVSFDIKGRLASATGKRLLIPADLFEANTTPQFPHEKREVPVYFQYPFQVQDAIRIAYPASMTVESLPTAQSVPLQKKATYTFTTEPSANAIVFRRDFAVGEVIFPVTEYPDLRVFFNKFESKDKESAVLRLATAAGN